MWWVSLQTMTALFNSDYFLGAVTKRVVLYQIMFITISISAQLLENGWDIDSWKGVLCGGVVGLPKLIQ